MIPVMTVNAQRQTKALRSRFSVCSCLLSSSIIGNQSPKAIENSFRCNTLLLHRIMKFIPLEILFDRKKYKIETNQSD